MKTKYFYISDLNFDGGVYQTQILDWIKLYNEYGLNFELIQVYSILALRNKNHKNIKKRIRTASSTKVHFYYFVPNVFYLHLINIVLFYLYLTIKIIKYQKVVIFSRAEIGQEINVLKKLYRNKLIYIYDLRGALAEEYIWYMKKSNNYTKSNLNILSNKFYSEYIRQKAADKIFVVSNTLKTYFINHYNSDSSKFVLYPCLSSIKKFYFDESIRRSTRNKLGFNDIDKVFIYSGGIINNYHSVEKFIEFFNKIANYESHVKLLLLVKESTDTIKNIILRYDNIIILENIPNKEVVKYLNASDYGLLLRENITLNNVAFPTKFAEYLLCGLPTIISESLIDCANYCKETNSGYIITNSEMENLNHFNPEALIKTNFNRVEIATKASKFLSKESLISELVAELKNFNYDIN